MVEICKPTSLAPQIREDFTKTARPPASHPEICAACVQSGATRTCFAAQRVGRTCAPKPNSSAPPRPQHWQGIEDQGQPDQREGIDAHSAKWFTKHKHGNEEDH